MTATYIPNQWQRKMMEAEVESLKRQSLVPEAPLLPAFVQEVAITGTKNKEVTDLLKAQFGEELTTLKQPPRCPDCGASKFSFQVLFLRAGDEGGITTFNCMNKDANCTRSWKERRVRW